MATLGDVEAGLCQALAGFAFPGQTYQFGSVATYSEKWTQAPGAQPISFSLQIGRGSPTNTDIEAAIASGVSTLTVSRQKGFSRNTSRFFQEYRQTSAAVPTLQVALTGDVATFGGTGSANQIVSVLAGGTNGTYYAYLAQASDTPASVAAALAAQIPGASASGAQLTIPNADSAAVACYQSGMFITGQQEVLINVTALAVPSAGATGSQVREALGFCVNGLKNMRLPGGAITRFIGLPDGGKARVLYHDEIDDDTTKRADVWRRFTGFRVEYDEAIYESWPVMLAPLIVGNTNGQAIMWFGPGAPVADLLTGGTGALLTDAAGNMLGGF